ncbi:MAG: hypothetical protein ACFFFK_10960, partial [Candidatus Thorarchaeota archaeon]
MKQWLGPLLVVLYSFCFILIFTDFGNFSLIGILSYLLFVPILGIAELISFPPTLLLMLPLAYAMFRKYDSIKLSELVFVVSFFFSGVIWTPSFTEPIDFLISFLNVTPYDILSTGIFGISNGYASFFLSSIILFTLSLLTTESIAFTEMRKLESGVAAIVLLVILIIWSYLPGLILITHQYV